MLERFYFRQRPFNERALSFEAVKNSDQHAFRLIVDINAGQFALPLFYLYQCRRGDVAAGERRCRHIHRERIGIAVHINTAAQKRENVGLSNFTDDVTGMHSCRDGVYIDWKFFSDICFFGVCLVRGCVADSSMRSCNKILDAKSG